MGGFPKLGGGIPLSIIDAAGDLIVGTANDAAGRLALGAALQGLRVNAGATALEYAAPAAAAIPLSLIDAAGDLVVGTANDAVGRLALGTALQGVRVNAAGTALEYAALPYGTLGYAAVTANQGSITTVADLTSLAVSVTPTAGRRLKITGEIEVQSTVLNDVARLQIQEGGSILQGGDAICSVANLTTKLICHAIIQPSAAAHTYKLTLQRVTGTGTLTMTAGASLIAFILVEDIGI